ncbi:hypothetical protein N657DRAFT_631050 [Parathielavia appendiculata]|uniref:Uncharacterized protein n=1 Tax=Parathielavia appendiculata TaxID=2587402 RepID=A0AAN6Z659_9PEZI|nr:hypothetical protein N657DRAFT_631050 [Parathielavia appendiculata]
MCIFHISHYRCGHDIKKLVHECDKYLGKKAEAGNLLCKVLSFTRPKTCGGRNVMLEEDIMSACGAACARKLHENMKRHQRELKRKDKELEKREKDRLGRAQAVAREYRQHKQKEEEALRRQKEEREQKERREREKERTGRQRQGAQSKPNLPFGSGTSRSGSSVSRSNARHVGRHQEGTLDDPRVQGPPTQAVAAQAVAAQKPAMVQSRPTQGQPSTARSPGKPETSPRPSVPANTEFRPPVPPKDHRRPVLPKDTWQPQHPNLVPAPLSLRAKPPARAARVPAQQPPPRGQLNGIRRDLLELDDRLSAPKRTVPKRKPVPVSAIKPEKKRNPWFKRLVGAPSSDTVDSVEWVSADAARVERETRFDDKV